MRQVLLHGHIFKNAGTTLDWSLERSYREGFLDHRDDQAMKASGGDLLGKLVASRPELVAVSSHCMPRQVPEDVGCAFTHLYMLRHPLLRVRSAYDFERKQLAKTPGAMAAKAHSFREYVEWRMKPRVSRTIRNYQTVYLAGRHRQCSNALLAATVFGAAIETMRCVPTIGVVERYDESMVVLEELLHPTFPALDLAYLPQNVSRRSRLRKAVKAGSPSPPEPVEKLMDELGDLARRVIDENSYDLALYQLVNARLDAQIESVPAFGRKLSEFKKRCEVLA